MLQFNTMRTLQTQTVALSRVNTIPFNMRGGLSFGAMMDNDAIFIFNDFSSALIIILRVRDNGDWCCYSNINNPFAFGAPNFGAGQCYSLQLNRNTFLLNNGNGRSNYVVIPNYFVSSGTVIINPLTFSPSAPCGSGTRLNSYYDFTSQLLAYTFADNHPVTQNYWASIYQVSPYGFSLLTGGYLGNAASTSDPFAQGVNNIFKSFIFGQPYGNLAYDKGRIIGIGLNAGGGKTQTGYLNRRINYAPLACGAASDAAYAYTEPAQVFLDSTITNDWAVDSHEDIFNAGACGIGDYVLTTCNNTRFFLWNALANLEVKLTGDFAGQTTSGTSINSLGNIVVLNKSNGAKNVGVFIAPFNQSILPILPPNVNNLHHGLMNLHRPVSVIGAFKT